MTNWLANDRSRGSKQSQLRTALGSAIKNLVKGHLEGTASSEATEEELKKTA